MVKSPETKMLKREKEKLRKAKQRSQITPIFSQGFIVLAKYKISTISSYATDS